MIAGAADELRPAFRFFLLSSLLALVAGYFIPISVADSTYRTALSVLITSQASVLAIVVSVTLISVQLVSTRYAPRMADLPFRTPLFKTTFLIFGLSILLGIVGIGITDIVPNQAKPALLAAAIVLVVFVGYALFKFIQGMVELTSPEELTGLFTSTLTPEKYVSETRAYAENSQTESHPLRPLYRMIMSAISQNEFGTAHSALVKYSDFSNDTISAFDESQTFSNESRDLCKQLFGPPLKDHLHEIAVRAAESDETAIVAEAIDTQLELGKVGMELEGFHGIPHSSFWGIRSTLIEQPVTPDDHYTFTHGWPALGELIEAEVEFKNYRTTVSIRDFIESRLYNSIEQSKHIGWHANATKRLFESVCDAHESLMKDIETEFSGVIGPLREDPSKEVTHLKIISRTIFAISENLLEYRLEHGVYPIIEGNFKTGWVELCTSAADDGNEEHAIELCRVLIELAFIENCERPFENDRIGPRGIKTEFDESRDILHWGRRLAKINSETEEPIVEQAFEEILAYEPKEGESPGMFTIESEEREQYYWPEISIDGYDTFNTLEQYPELLEELRTKSLEG